MKDRINIQQLDMVYNWGIFSLQNASGWLVFGYSDYLSPGAFSFLFFYIEVLFCYADSKSISTGTDGCYISGGKGTGAATFKQHLAGNMSFCNTM